MKLSAKEHSVKLKITKCRRGGSLRPPKNFLQINGRHLRPPYKKINISSTHRTVPCVYYSVRSNTTVPFRQTSSSKS